jgi:hypothetical protein
LSLRPHFQCRTRPSETSAPAAAPSVLDLKGLNYPVIIESIQLLTKGRDRFVCVRSKDGVKGVNEVRSPKCELASSTFAPARDGRMNRNQDALPGRTEKLIPLSRKTLGDQVAIHADGQTRACRSEPGRVAFPV